MINVISSTGIDSVGSGSSFSAVQETDPYADLFAALFSVPVTIPLTDSNKPEASATTATELNTDSLSGSGGFASFLFDSNVEDIPKQNPQLHEIFPELRLRTPSPKTKMPDALSEVDEDILDIVTTRPAESSLEPEGKLADAVSPTEPGRPVLFSEPPIQSEPAVGGRLEPFKVTKLNPDNILPPVFERKPDASPTDINGSETAKQLTKPSVAAEASVNRIGLERSVDIDKTVNLKTSESTATIIDSTVVEGVSEVTSFAVFEPLTKRYLKADSQRIIRGVDSLLTTFTNNVLAEKKIVELARQSFGGGSEKNAESLFADLVKPDQEPGVDAKVAEFAFGASLTEKAKVQTVGQIEPANTKLNRVVLDQIVPMVFDLTALTTDGFEEKTLKIRLTPADLGAVDITVVRTADGKIEAHFQTESPQTQHILNESLAQLRDSLERSGLQVGDLNTSCTTFSSGGNENRGERPKEFGSTERNTAEATAFDGISKTEDDGQDRLVSLRA